MMQVDVEKCTGCGDCLEVCPNGAIFLVGGKATIDIANCLSCGTCETACPEGAISESRQIVTRTVMEKQPANIQTVPPIKIVSPATAPENRLSWVRPILSYVGLEILPRLADTLLSALDRRLSATTSPTTIRFNSRISPQGGARQRQVRRRRRVKNR